MIDHLSVSSINLAMDCPRSWWAKYVLKKSRPSSAAANFGLMYDMLVSQRLGCKSHKEEELPGEITEELINAVEGYLCQPHALKSATDAQLPINFTPGQWAVTGEMLGIDVEIPVPITGFIDLYDRERRIIVDLKTSSSKRTRFTWAMQILVYSLAKQANEAKIHLLTRTKIPCYYEFMVPVTDDSRRWAMRVFSFYAQQIKKWLDVGAGEDLPRLPDYHCSWCPEELECEARNVLLGG